MDLYVFSCKRNEAGQELGKPADKGDVEKHKRAKKNKNTKKTKTREPKSHGYWESTLMWTDQEAPGLSIKLTGLGINLYSHWSPESLWWLKSQEDMGLLVSEDLNPIQGELESKTTKCITDISMSPYWKAPWSSSCADCTKHKTPPPLSPLVFSILIGY